jgi:hypothetical protein
MIHFIILSLARLTKESRAFTDLFTILEEVVEVGTNEGKDWANSLQLELDAIKIINNIKRKV